MHCSQPYNCRTAHPQAQQLTLVLTSACSFSRANECFSIACISLAVSFVSGLAVAVKETLRMHDIYIEENANGLHTDLFWVTFKQKCFKTCRPDGSTRKLTT